MASAEALRVLRALKSENVLLSGPPATGKTAVLNEVRALFEAGAVAAPTHGKDKKVPFPKLDAELSASMPAPERTDRKTWFVSFHQDYQYKNFIGGLVATLQEKVLVPVPERGVLLQAADHASTDLGASLLIIDEVNRGNATRIFGEAISVLDIDKRLGPDGTPTALTIDLEIPLFGSFALPRHVYVLAAMNTADVSVAPLDIAFRRRFEEQRIQPSLELLASHLGLATPTSPPTSEKAPADIEDVKRMAHAVLAEVNRKIEIAAGRDYLLGHGFFWQIDEGGVEEAVASLQSGWKKVVANIEEMFRGDEETLGAVLTAFRTPQGRAGYPYYFEHHSIPNSAVDRTVLHIEEKPLGWMDFRRLAGLTGEAVTGEGDDPSSEDEEQAERD